MTELNITEVQRDVLSVMRSVREIGVDVEAIRAMGAPQPSALIQHLRMRGYEIEETEYQGRPHYRLVTDARITGMRRKQAQLRLGEGA